MKMFTRKTRSLKTVSLSFKDIFTSIILVSVGIIFSLQSMAQTTVTLPVGTTTWLCPGGVTSVTVECWGGGGGGGAATGNPAGGGGGAGGSYSRVTSLAVNPGTTYNVNVGAGGTIGATVAGGQGGFTWFNTAGTVYAVGGAGGALATANNTSAAGGTATTTGNIGSTIIIGGNGGTGATGATAGGGGGSAGTALPGNPGGVTTGGLAVSGGGAGGNGGVTSGGGGTGNPGAVPGAGGGGGRAGNNANRAGAVGGAGQIKITYTQLTYKSQLVSMSLGSATWCTGETRNVTIQIKNIGTATWTDASPDINIGVKWNTNGANWTDYHIRTDAGNLAPGATGTYVLPITASNNMGAGYTTPLAAGTNNLIFDVVYEGVSWFGDNNGGVGPGNVKFTSPAQTIVALPTITKGSNPVVCQGVTTANLTYSATTGTPNQYSIDYNAAANTAGFVDVVNAALPATPIPMTVPGAVAAGTYNATLTVTNSTTGCSGTAAAIAVTVNANSTLVLTSVAGTDAQTVCANVAITNITYAIGGGGTGASITAGALPAGVTGSFAAGVFTISGTPTAAGNFSYTVTTSGGSCTQASLSGTITVNANSTITLSSAAGTDAQTVCINTAITNITYAVAGGGTGASITAGVLPAGITGSFAAGVFTISGTPTVSGNFSYTVTTTGPCVNPSLSGTITVTANSTISLASAAGTDGQAVCINNAITDITYAIGGGGTGASITAGALPAGVSGSFAAGVFTINGTPTVSGSFSYTVTTSGPCVNNSLSGTITVNANATIALTSGVGTDAQAVCNNSAITNITYAIGAPGTGASITSGALPAGVAGSFASGVFTISGTPTVAGLYNYTITATGGCAQVTASGTITVNAHPTATFTKTMVSSCGGGADGTITVTPSGNGPFTYSWTSTPAGFTANTAMITGLTPRDYTVLVTDANLCSVTIPDIYIGQAFPAVVTNNGGISSSCGNTGYIILYGSGGVQPYTFSIDGTNYFAGNTFNNLAAGTYTGYVKDFSGCVSTKSNIVVGAAAAIAVTANTRSASSCANNAVIELYRTGGIAPFTYSLDDVTYQVSNTFNNLVGATTYTGWVKDASGCKTSLANIAVGKAPAVTISATAANTSSCSNTGRIQLLAGGGVPGYTYSLNNGPYQAGNAFTGLAAGSYDGRVKDSKNCVNVQLGITVGTDAAPTITVTAYATSTSSCGNNGSIQLFRTGGTGPFTYSIDNVTYQVSNTFTGLAGGTYTGYVKDVNTCTGLLAGITVVQAPAVTVTERHTNTSTCANDGTIQLTPGGGVAGYTYSLDNITYQAGNSFAGKAAGSYTGWAKDSKGCTASVPVTIGTSAAIVVTAYATAASSCNVSNGSIQLFRTGGTGPFTYSLDNITYQAGNTFSGLAAGTYTGYVKDSKGCIGSLSNIVVGPNCAPPIAGQGKNSRLNTAKVSGNELLSVQAYPNPAATEFTLVLTGRSKEKISISVTDIMGRNVQQAELNGKNQYRFGADLKPGIYIVHVVQAGQKQSIKLVKE